MTRKSEVPVLPSGRVAVSEGAGALTRWRDGFEQKQQTSLLYKKWFGEGKEEEEFQEEKIKWKLLLSSWSPKYLEGGK